MNTLADYLRAGLAIVSIGLNPSLRSVAAGFYSKFRESQHEKLESYTKELFILVFFLFGFGIFFAESLLGLFYGPSFKEAALILRLSSRIWSGVSTRWPLTE